MKSRYHARTEDLVVQQLGDDLLIYDRHTDVAHSLSETAALVWRLSEGGATVEEMTEAVAAQGAVGGRQEAEAIVLQAVNELEEKVLLEQEPGTEKVSRRHALQRMAGVGAGAVLAPLVVSAAVPKPAEAFGRLSTCHGAGGSCTPGPNTCGSSTTNTCCPAGVQGCP